MKKTVILLMTCLLLCLNFPVFAGETEKTQCFAETNASANRNIYSDYDHQYDAALREAMLNGITDITDDKYGLTKDKYQRMIQYVQFSTPEIIDIEDYYREYVLETDRTRGYYVVYSTTFSEDKAAFSARLPKVLEELRELIPENATDLQKVLIAHDYLVASTRYNQANKDASKKLRSDYDAYGVFVNHGSMCQGYSNAFKYLMDNLGIECALAESNTANHAWNLVKLNGEWYHVDCSADDSSYDMLGEVKHNYFLISTETLLGLNDARSDFVVVADDYNMVFTDDTCATDKQYESGQIWTDVKSMCYFYNNDVYTVNNTGLCKNGELFYYPGVSMIWHPYNISGANYTATDGVFGRIAGEGNTLYMSTPKSIHQINLDTGEGQVFYTPDLTWQETICGFGKVEGVYYYCAKESMPTKGSEETWTEVPGLGKPVLAGDVNQDGLVTIADAEMAKKAAMKTVDLDEKQFKAADLDGNNIITINEARKIKRAVLSGIEL